MSAPEIMTGPEIREYLRLSGPQLTRLATRPTNPLPARKVAGMGWRARKSDLDQWFDNLKDAA